MHMSGFAQIQTLIVNGSTVQVYILGIKSIYVLHFSLLIVCYISELGLNANTVKCDIFDNIQQFNNIKNLVRCYGLGKGMKFK